MSSSVRSLLARIVIGAATVLGLVGAGVLSAATGAPTWSARSWRVKYAPNDQVSACS